MDIVTLYRYQRDGGGVTVSPEKPECEYTETYRIIADEGKAVTLDGIDLRPVVDTDSTAGWYEVDDPEYENPDEATESDYQTALREMGVDV